MDIVDAALEDSRCHLGAVHGLLLCHVASCTVLSDPPIAVQPPTQSGQLDSILGQIGSMLTDPMPCIAGQGPGRYALEW